MTPNTDALLSLHWWESVPNNVRRIQRFPAHIMDIPTTHRAVVIPNRWTHSPLLLFFTFSVFSFSHYLLSASLTFCPFQAMSLATKLFFSSNVISDLVFPILAAQELCQEGSTFDPAPSPILLVFSVLFLFLSLRCVFSSHMSSPLLSQWWTRGHKYTGRQRTFNIQQMAGAPHNVPVLPLPSKHKSSVILGDLAHAITSTVTSISHPLYF